MSQIDYFSPPPKPVPGRVGLILFGVLVILIGSLFAMSALALPLMFMLSSAFRRQSAAGDLRGIAMSCAMNLLIAAILIGCGIGSILARRWVRPIMQIIGWTWLLTGLFSLAIFAFMMPDLMAQLQQKSPGVGPSEAIILTIILAVLFVVYILLPTLIIWFYRRPQVQAALIHYNPRPSWTDRCPMPVLALSLGWGLGAVSSLFGLVYCAMPLFGVILTGIPAAIALLLVTAAMAYAAITTYRLQWVGWWSTLALTILLPLSAAISTARLGYLHFYRVMKMPDEQLQAIQQYRYLNDTSVLTATIVLGLFFTAYTLYVRKFFRPA